MDFIGDWILDAISKSRKVGILLSSTVVIVVSINYFYPFIAPNSIVNILYSWLMVSSLGALPMQLRYRKYPTVTNRTCPICENNLIYSTLKCSSGNCDFSADIPKDKILI